MELSTLQQQAGATFSDQGIVQDFCNQEQVTAALDQGVVLCDRSHWGILSFSGADRIRYLHNQSTNDFEKLQPGAGCETVFVTSTARTLDLATAYLEEERVLAIVSPERREQLLAWLDRFIFPFDQVELTDASAKYALFSLLGSDCDKLLANLINQPLPQQPHEHQLFTIEEDIQVRIAFGSGLSTLGYTLLVPQEQAAQLWSKLTQLGAIPMGDRQWENLRIQQGRPTPDRELTEDYNPLEAGLWQTISFDKGCYIGQETIARLNTYNGVKQRLWGIKLSQPVPLQTPITLDGQKIGKLTSFTETSEGAFGLGYIRTKAGGAGLKVQIGEAEGQVQQVSFISHKSQSLESN